MPADATTLALACLAFFAGGVASGAVGMGAALIAAPMLALVDPQLVPYTLPVALTWSSVAGWASERRSTDWRRVGWWLAGSVPGWAAGVVLLKAMTPRGVAVLVGLAGLVAAALVAATLQVPARRRWLLLVGSVAGAGSATAGMNGPFVATTVTGLAPSEVRPTLLAYFVPGNVITATLWASAGLLSWLLVVTGMLGGVAAVCGVAVGTRLRAHVDGRWFPLVVAALCAAAALRALLG